MPKKMRDIKKGETTHILNRILGAQKQSSLEDKLSFVKQNYIEILKEILDIADLKDLSEQERNDYELLSIVDRRDSHLMKDGNLIGEFNLFCHQHTRDKKFRKDEEFQDMHRKAQFLIVNEKGELLVDENLGNKIHSSHVKLGNSYKDTILENLNIGEHQMHDINVQNFLKYIIHTNQETEFSDVRELKIRNGKKDSIGLDGEFMPISELAEIVADDIKRGKKSGLNELIFLKYLKFRGNRVEKGIKEIENGIKKGHEGDFWIVDDKTLF